MNKKGKLKAFFDSVQDKRILIKEYEENIDFFNDLLNNGHKEDIEFVIPIKMYKYADNLSQTGNYSKALKVLYEIEEDLEKIKGQSKWFPQYLEGVTFLKGVSLSRLKRYSDSNIEFEKILRKNPTNDNFIDWYKSNRKDSIHKILNYISIFGMVFFITATIIDIFFFNINRIIGYSGLIIGFSSAFVFPKLSQKIIDKQKIKIKTAK